MKCHACKVLGLLVQVSGCQLDVNSISGCWVRISAEYSARQKEFWRNAGPLAVLLKPCRSWAPMKTLLLDPQQHPIGSAEPS